MVGVAAWLALLAGPAEARVYHVLKSGADAWTVMDPQALERLPGTRILRGWSVTVQRSIHGAGGPLQPGYVRALYDYDCEFSLTRWRSLSIYSSTGVLLITDENKTPRWVSAAAQPETLAAWRVACSGGAGASVISADSIGQVVIALLRSFDPPPAPAPAPAPASPPPSPKRR